MSERDILEIHQTLGRMEKCLSQLNDSTIRMMESAQANNTRLLWALVSIVGALLGVRLAGH